MELRRREFALRQFEKIVDLRHVLDHVSWGAEGIFGKDTADGQAWYRKMEALLLEYEDGVIRVIRSLEYYGCEKKRTLVPTLPAMSKCEIPRKIRCFIDFDKADDSSDWFIFYATHNIMRTAMSIMNRRES